MKPSFRQNLLILLLHGYAINLSWYNLLVRKFPEAESVARAGFALAQAQGLDVPSREVETNLAHALLFQNRFTEAEAIYRDLKDRPNPKGNTKTFTSALLDDFDALEKAGITHPDVAKIRAQLGATVIKPEAAVEPKKSGKP